MSIVRYNGISLTYPLHSAFSMETVFDPSGTDLMYTKIDATVQCLINRDFFSTIDSSLLSGVNPKGDLAGSMRWIRFKLMQARKDLTISVGGTNLIPPRQTKDAGGGRTVDARNGPQPQSCVITKMSDNSFLVTYRIIGHYWENFSDADGAIGGLNRDGNIVISCRWSETQEIDQRNFSVRRRDGTFVIRSDNVSKAIADDVRGLFAVVGIAPGFVRKSARYTIQPDGLAMAFSIEDQEVYLMPPFPAFEADGYYSESSTTNGANRQGECYVQLKGTLGANAGVDSKDRLLEIALVVMIRKLKQVNATGGDGQLLSQRVLLSSTIRTSLYDNIVECRALIWFGPIGRKKTFGFNAVNLSAVVSPPTGSDPATAKAPAVSDRGAADLLIQAAAYFDPSLENQKLNKDLGQLFPGNQVGTD